MALIQPPPHHIQLLEDGGKNGTWTTWLYDLWRMVIKGDRAFKFISEFGANPNNPDNTDAFAKAVTWMNDQVNPPCLIFEPGIYIYQTSPNWAVDYATITACGVVRLRNEGAGDGMIFDGGAAGAGITGMRVGRFLIEGIKTSGDGVYVRAVHRSEFDLNVRGCGTTQAALRTEWCVIDVFTFVASLNEGGWYNPDPPAGEAEPFYGLYLDERDPGEATSYCTFINPILEGVDLGAYIDNAIGNQFYGGTMENCVTYGMHLTENALWNKTYGLDLEQNGSDDVYCEGDNNFFSGMDTFADITITTGAKGNQIVGGSHSQITVDAGAIGTLLSDLTYNRFNDGSTITNNGTNTRIDNCYDYGNGTWSLRGLIPLTAYDPEPARSSESNIHGGLLSLATAQPLDSVPTNIVVSKGIGKLVVVVNAGSDISGSITVTGTSVNRETGVQTGSDTDTLTVDALTTDTSGADGNGNTLHGLVDAYITSKWFTGSVTLSTSDLTLTDADVYHVSYEQFNDFSSYTIQTFDVNLLTTNVNAEFDAYLYTLVVTGDKCVIGYPAELHVGTGGNTAIANRYERLRRGNIGSVMNGATDGMWVDVHYANSPAYIEDATIKVWGEV